MTLGDKIRALKPLDWYDSRSWNAALDRAAALADEHEADASAALELRDAQMRAQGRIEAGAVFATTGAEERYVADTENACPACGGSGHKDDARAAMDRIKAEAVKEALSDFAKADWFWRDLDPDDCGDTPDEAINAGMVGSFTVCHIRSSFTGPDRFCFIAPVLDPESDDEECLCFVTEDEAVAAAKGRRAILAAAGEAVK